MLTSFNDHKVGTDDDGSTKMVLNPDALVVGAVQHIQFLRQLHALGVTLQEPSPHCIHRYLDLWLPLAATHHDETPILPPPDIAWIWHCHRLAPLRYECYSLKRFGKVVESSAPFQFQNEGDEEDKDADATRRMWELKYPEEPFYLNENSTPVGGTWQLDADGFDLVGSTSRQKTFLWQVSQPRFEDLGFIQEGVLNYQRFVTLKRGKVSLPLVPTYQIDLLWHTHIAMSVTQYNLDCMAIRGEKFNHDDSLNDRTPGALLDRSFQETCRLWEKEYGQSYPEPGGMYRGTPPGEFLDPLWDWEISQTAREISVLLAGSNSTGEAQLGEKVDDSIPNVSAKTSKGAKTRKTATKTKAGECSAASSTSFDPIKTPWKQAIATGGGNSPFIVSAPKSTTKGVNSNAKRSGYVYGKGCSGDGFYSLETKDAYDILYRRLEKRQLSRKQSVCHHVAKIENMCCSCFKSSTKARINARIKELQDDLAETAKMQAYIQARKDAAGPKSLLRDDTVKQYQQAEFKRQNLDYAMYPFVTGYWYASGGNITTTPSGTGEGDNTAPGSVEGFEGLDNYTNDLCKAAGCGGGTCGGGSGGGCGAAACGGGEGDGGDGGGCGGGGCGGCGGCGG